MFPRFCLFRDEGAQGQEGGKILTEDDIETNWDECIETFDAMELREELLRGIYAYGFEKPSAIQQVCCGCVSLLALLLFRRLHEVFVFVFRPHSSVSRAEPIPPARERWCVFSYFPAYGGFDQLERKAAGEKRRRGKVGVDAARGEGRLVL